MEIDGLDSHFRGPGPWERFDSTLCTFSVTKRPGTGTLFQRVRGWEANICEVVALEPPCLRPCSPRSQRSLQS